MTAPTVERESAEVIEGQVFKVPLIARGRLIEDYEQVFAARAGGVSFTSPSVSRHLSAMVAQPADLDDIHRLSVREIAQFLVRVGERLKFDTNEYVQQAFEVSKATSGISAPILEVLYRSMPQIFVEDTIMRFAESQVGIDYLDRWVELSSDGGLVTSVRAFGARSVHIIAGNSPAVAMATILRNAITRGNAIIKLPSNDPLTATAIARTMIDVDPEHPVTRHVSVAYWKGGDEAVEARVYTPRNIEKIIAWGGYASVQHVTRYLRPGIDLITLDPKHSASIVGREALADEVKMRKVALRAAIDIGAFNQETCANARVIYVECNWEDKDDLARLNTFGQYVFDALQSLGKQLSTPAKSVKPELKEELDGLQLQDEWYRVIRKDDLSGAIIVSQTDESVSFAELLACRTANLVPVATLEGALKRINASSQTIGIYPEALKEKIRDRLALQGAQHIISLGGVIAMGLSGPQDGLEPERRMLKWIKHVSLPYGD